MLGLVPKASIEILEKAPFNGPITVKVGSTNHAISRAVASIIQVKVRQNEKRMPRTGRKRPGIGSAMMLLLEPFFLSLIAGLATGVGGIIVLFLRKVSDRIVSLLMGFASGVMLMVAFNNLFLEAEKMLAHIELITFFAIGAFVMMALDLAIPHIEPTRRKENGRTERMHQSGVLIAVGVTLHNLPEGFVVAAGYIFNPALGLVIAVAIILHNIPEGIATAIPLSESWNQALENSSDHFSVGLG